MGAVLGIGLVCYGLSLLLVLQAMRVLGGGRASLAFSVSPVVGGVAGLALGTYATPVAPLLAAALLAGAGTWLLVSETHEHLHAHDELDHTHEHVHDAHHQHEHLAGDPPGEPHTHRHRHAPLTHAHPHLADLHHRHH